MSSVRRLGAGIAGALFIARLLCPVSAAEADFREGSKKIAARIDEILRTQNPMQNPFRNTERVEMLRRFIAKTEAEKPNSVPHVAAESQLAMELLRVGEMEESLKTIEKVQKIYEVAPQYAAGGNELGLMMIKALDYLRIGEVQNCFALHGPDSCILPLRGDAFHKKPFGSREAIRTLTDFLKKNPTSLHASWLLNIAYMTLNEYPTNVPPGYLIPPTVFDSEYDIKRFVNIANPLGIEVGQLAGGAVVEDFDNDGDLDLLTSSWRPTDGMHLFENNGEGAFNDITARAGLDVARGGLNLIQTDYNNDGFADVLVLRAAWQGAAGHFPQSLLKNNGNGTFSDVTEQAKILVERPTQTAAWFDYDNDGWVDLFMAYESTQGDTNRCQLFRNNKDGTFTDVAAQVGLNIAAFVKGVTAGDYNNDGRTDLFLSCGGEPNHLFRNDGIRNNAWTFTDVSATAGVSEPARSFPTWFFDYDNDGLLDLFVSGYFIKNVGDVAADYLGLRHNAERLHLFRNKGDGSFDDVTKSVNLYKTVPTMGCNFGDLDNDGWLDFYLATGDPDNSTIVPNRMFRNAGGKRFQDVTTSGGFGHLQKGHGVAFADFDNDGDQDIYTVMGGAFVGDTARSVLFENPGHGNHWIKLKLEGVRSNRAAIGARIKLVVQTPSGERSIYKTVNTGGSFGANPLRQDIGLADATKILRAEIFWPVTGKTQSVDTLELDRAYRIKEDATKPELLSLKKAKFAVAKNEEK
jgi:hypothetical protein